MAAEDKPVEEIGKDLEQKIPVGDEEPAFEFEGEDEDLELLEN